MTCKPATPCAQCGDTPEPVLPRCQDIVLPDGVYTNATVTVEAGCVTAIAAGAAPLYTPDPCCGTAGGGGTGGIGLQGPQGDPGAAATVSVGTVNTVPAGSSASVTNVGTPNAAVFNFNIPQGAAGASASGSGLTGDYSGLILTNGAVQLLPTMWPPVLQVVSTGSSAGVTLTAVKDAAGTMTIAVDLSVYDADIRADFQALLDAQAADITTLQAQVAALCAGAPCP